MAVTPEPAVSVVVPVRDGARTVGALLDGLARQTLPRDRFEVVVVDNGSTDGTAEVVHSHGAVLVEDPVPNRARARNLGVARARADLIAFTDADCLVAPGWLEALVACAPRAGLVAGPVVVTTSRSANAVERFETLWRFDQEEWVRQGWAATANLGVTRSAFEAGGGFDETWRHIGEDVDFCLRATRAGARLAFCPDAVVLHAAEVRLGPLLRRSWRHGYSVTQAFHRLGLGYQAWRHPGPLLTGAGALAAVAGRTGELGAGPERRRMGALAQAAYAARVAGSLWAEVTRAR